MRIFITFLLLAAPWLPAAAQTISDTAKSRNAAGDHGYWQAGQPDIMILWPADDMNIVRRYRSAAGHPYKLWVDPARGGGFPVVLKDRAAFDNFLDHIKNRADKNWCEFIENPWSAWAATGPVPGACGIHQYTERRTCSTGGAVNPCPNTCAAPAETRQRRVDNGPCEPEPPTCAATDWTPARSTACDDAELTQTRTLENCETERRAVAGTKSCAACAAADWSPARNIVCDDVEMAQTRTLTDCTVQRRTIAGTKSCGVCAAGDWSPAAADVCNHQEFIQTRTMANCERQHRRTTGQKACRVCPASDWSPLQDTACEGFDLTQTRTLRNCETEERVVDGAIPCAARCPGSTRPYLPVPGMCCLFTSTPGGWNFCAKYW